MVARKHVGTRMGPLQPRCTENLLYVLTLLETVGTLVLMAYALLWEAGNLVNLPDKRIGFYNFCLWNDTAGELLCLENKQLQAMGINLLAAALATVCVYSCLVIICFYLLYEGLTVKCPGEEGWKVRLIIHIITLIILFGGLIMFSSQTSQWIHLSDFTGGFLALLGTQALLLLQILTAAVYLRWVKHTCKCVKAN